MEECRCTEKCSVEVSTEIASIGLCQPQSQSMPLIGMDLLRGRPCLPRKKEKPRLEDKKNEQEKIRKERAECPDYCPTE